MNLSTILLLVISFIGHFAYGSINSRTIFVEEGSIVTYDSSWLLSFGLNINQYEKPLKQLRVQVQYFENAFESLSELDNIEVYYSKQELQARQTMLDLFKRKSSEFYNRYSQLEYLINAGENMLTDTKKSSGSISTLLNQPSAALGRNGSSLSKFEDNFYRQVSVIDTSFLQFNDPNDSLNKLINVTHTFKTSMTEFHDRLSQKVEADGDFISIALQMIDMFELVSDALHYTILSLDDFINSVRKSEEGSLSKSLISQNKLYKILRKIQSRLPEGFNLPFSLSHKYIHKYYESSWVVPVIDDNQLRFAAFIPIGNANSRFHIFRAMPVPSDLKGQSGVYEVDPLHIAVSPDHTRYVLLSTQEIDRCKSDGVCNLKGPIYRTTNYPYCLMSLYTKNRIQIINYCNNSIHDDVKETSFQHQKGITYGALIAVISSATLVAATFATLCIFLNRKKINQTVVKNETRRSLFRTHTDVFFDACS